MLRLAEASKVKREEFLQHWRGAELDPALVRAARQAAGQGLEGLRRQARSDDVEAMRAEIGTIATETGLPVAEFRRVYATVSRGERDMTPGEEGDDRGEPAPRDLHRQEVHQPRPAVPGPDPGGQHRPDEGGGQVRVPPRLQVQHLRHLVDPPGDHAQHRRPGADHPHPRAHDRDDQQAGPHLAARCCTRSAASRRRRSWPRSSACRSRRCARC